MSAFLYNMVNGEVKEHRVCPSRVAGMLKSGYKATPKELIEAEEKKEAEAKAGIEREEQANRDQLKAEQDKLDAENAEIEAEAKAKEVAELATKEKAEAEIVKNEEEKASKKASKKTK